MKPAANNVYGVHCQQKLATPHTRDRSLPLRIKIKHMQKDINYQKVENYLKKFSLEVPPYDPNGAIHLLKAIIENLQEHFMDYDFEQYAACLDEKNEAFLKRLLKVIPKSRLININQDRINHK